MGNQTSQLPPTGKVILLDGSIQHFDNPLTVAELMLEYPRQVVVELKHGCDQPKPVPLPADKKLEFDKVYLMVPLRRGRPAHLSSVDAHNILISANTCFSSSSKNVPLFGKVEVEMFEEVDDEKGEYLSRQFSSRGWKPNLEAIEEKKNETKSGSKLVVIVGKVGKRIHSKGLVWG